MRVASIHTYPVKSCHRVDTDRAVVQPWGLAGDRRFMVVDAEGVAVTQREAPALTGVMPSPRPDGGVRLRARDLPDLEVPPPLAPPVPVRIWGGTVEAMPAGDEADAWFTKFLGRPVRLVWLDDPTRRRVNPAYGSPFDRVSFADAHPLLVTNAASLDRLNEWLREADSPEGPLPMDRFRPSVVVSGAPPWAEDGWVGQRLRVGTVTFRVAKPCGRCVVTTTDQETGARGTEPLRTLARRRAVDGRLVFGVLLNPDPPYGEIAVGDPVTVLPAA
ncbi:MAG TPA: MOSC N-terminal beta barrel domain-containing protein [Natronosporangium sp.]|jgi:uncharacterized protein YcbX